MATNASVVGLADKWESCRHIRDRIRDYKALFLESIANKPLEINIHGAEHHVDVLMPLLQMLVDPTTGEIGMCSIPLLEQERPSSICMFFA